MIRINSTLCRVVRENRFHMWYLIVLIPNLYLLTYFYNLGALFSRLQPQSEYHEQMRREFGVCQKTAEKYHCNYYAWSHRIWVIQHCHNCSIPVSDRHLSVFLFFDLWACQRCLGHYMHSRLNKLPSTEQRRTYKWVAIINSLLANGDFCHLLITFANSFDLDQDQHFFGPDLYPNRLTH